ncbi:23492_t:CDS:2, partial [Gigaspora margarita]
MVGQYYDTKKDILDAAQENAKNLGFAVAIKSSSSRHLYIHCKYSGQPRNNWDLTVDTRQRKRMSKRCECSYLLKAVPDNSKWRILEIKDEHTIQWLKIFGMVYEAVRNDNKTPIATRKDISNLSAQIHSVEERILMEALIA